MNEATIDSNGRFSFNGTFRWIVGGVTGLLTTILVIWASNMTTNVIANDKESRERDGALHQRVNTVEKDLGMIRTSQARVEEKIDYLIKNVDGINKDIDTVAPRRRTPL